MPFDIVKWIPSAGTTYHKAIIMTQQSFTGEREFTQEFIFLILSLVSYELFY